MSLFALKLIAIITMTIDHVGRFFFADQIEWLLVGRLAFPIFAWGIANGYHHTRDIKKYMTRLGIFALISQIPFTLTYLALFYNPTMLNIFFTLLLGLVAIYAYDHIPKKFIGVLVVFGITLLAAILPIDYGPYGILLTFVFYLTYGQPKRMLFWQTVLWLVLLILSQVALLTPFAEVITNNFVSQIIIVQVVALFSVLLISLYNGVQGPRFKWLFYWYYPVHLIVLLVIAMLM